MIKSDSKVNHRDVLLKCFSLEKVLFYNYNSNSYTYYVKHDDNTKIGNIIFDFKTRLYFWIDDLGVKDSCYIMFNKYVAIDFRYENSKIDNLSGIIGFKVLKCFEQDNKALFESLDIAIKKTSPSGNVLSTGTITDWIGEKTYLKLIKPGIDEEFSHYLIGFIYSEDVDLDKLAQVSCGINVKYAHGVYWMMIPKNKFDNNNLVEYSLDMILPNRKLIL